jgi:hypothetical protein
MRYLLDTGVWLWSQTRPERLGRKAFKLLSSPPEEDELFLSGASSWELSIKFHLGKLPLPEPPALYVPPSQWPKASTHHPCACAGGGRTALPSRRSLRPAPDRSSPARRHDAAHGRPKLREVRCGSALVRTLDRPARTRKRVPPCRTENLALQSQVWP